MIKQHLKIGITVTSFIVVCILLLMISTTAFAMDCKNIGARCVDGPEERDIDGYKVFKECWKYEDSFECSYSSLNSCEALRNEGCIHVRGEGDKEDQLAGSLDDCLIKYKDSSKCLNHKKKYVCYKDVETEEDQERIRLKNTKREKKIGCSKGPKCLDGKCFSDETLDDKKKREKENANDMQKVISQIAAAQEMAKDQERDGTNENIVSVFKGEAMRCKKMQVVGINIRDCCGAKPGGLGIKLGLTKCREDAQAMLDRRGAGHCVDLGSYCSKKVKVLGCVEKKHTYCCFGGKLQRIIQEQGHRDQLKHSFGEADSPHCDGLTVEELSELNFDNINFDEFYEDLMSKFKTPDVSVDTSRVQSAFKDIQEDFTRDGGEDRKPKDRTDQAHFRNKKFNAEVIDDETGVSRNRSHM